jgi:WhiB family redox-sensing transcriptional regulator
VTIQSTDWLSDAVCKGKTALFFTPAERETKRDKETRELIAMTYCAQCPVKDPCRQYGRENNELGIWGGENEEMRWKAGYLRSNIVSSRRKFARRFEREQKKDLENGKIDA